MAVTIKDVAKSVGVSASTVSRVLTGHAGIGEKTRLRVLEAVTALGYHPNAAARSLVNARSHLLCAVLPTGDHFRSQEGFLLDGLVGLAQHARERGYQTVLVQAPTSEEEFRALMEAVTGRSADGFILFSEKDKVRAIEALRKSGVPCVLVGDPVGDADAPYVSSDFCHAMHRETERLIALGHRRIAFLGGPSYRSASKEKSDGYFSTMLEHGLPVDETIVQTGAEHVPEAGERFVESRIQHGTPNRLPFTALLASSDLQAIGAAKAFRRNGIRGVSVVGCHALAASASADPPFSTIDVHPRRIGGCAARLLIDRIEGRNESIRHYIVRSTPIDRGSVGPPPASFGEPAQNGSMRKPS